MRGFSGPRSYTNTELFDERAAQMSELLRMRAPHVVIGIGARLMARAADGGHARHIWAEICDFATSRWTYYVAAPVSYLLCRFNIWHSGEHDDSGMGCIWCERGADPLVHQLLVEEEN